MGQAADSFWLDILVGYCFSAGFLSVDRPVVVRIGKGGCGVRLLNCARRPTEKKDSITSGHCSRAKVGPPISTLIGHLVDALPARVLK